MNSLPALQDRINKLAESTASTATLVRGRPPKPISDQGKGTRVNFDLVRAPVMDTKTADEASDGISQESSHHTDTDLKQHRLQHFHDLNQQFLRQQQSQQQQSQQQQSQQQQSQQQQSQQRKIQHENNQEKPSRQDEINELKELVQHLSNELRATQDAHQLNKDQSRSEIELLRSELDRQSSRHEQIVALFRKRLVESETARMKMQDQLSSHVDEDTQREEDLKDRWNQMTTCILEETKWVDEQMDHWKESMEELHKRLGAAKLSGRMDAELGGRERSTSPRSITGGEGRKAARNKSNESSSSDGNGTREVNKSLSQRRRRRWGRSGDKSDDDDDDSDDTDDTDEEEIRMYGQVLN